MNTQQSIDLYQKGRDEWNVWASTLLAEKTELESSGKPLVAWQKKARVDFKNRDFVKDVDFSGFIFPWDAYFNKATFPHLAKFDDARFHGDAIFERVTFKGLARFRSARFHSLASFNSIRAESTFDLANASFEKSVPNFIQSHFPEAPRFDHVSVPTALSLRRAGVIVDRYTTARYRALKRLAIQGHDYDRELQFFADELRSQLGRPCDTRKTFIALYGFFSDFGRSLLRPLLAWLLLTAICGGLYLGVHDALNPIKNGGSCIEGQGSPVADAVYLTMRKALIFPGLGQDSKLDLTNACLFGTKTLTSPDGEHNRVVPHIPGIIAYVGMTQTLLSGALIFLFLLAVRNQFRIK